MPQSEWISVSDRMPPEGVVVEAENGYEDHVYRSSVSLKCWRNEDTNEWHRFSVTYWRMIEAKGER